MKINYQETTNDLQTRIDIHNQFGGRNIDEWMLAVLALHKGMKILDVGCGAGKQCFTFFHALEGKGEITGGDVNTNMLAQARQENARTGERIRFMELDFNQRFPFEDNTFDLLSCCFAIYYAEDIPFTIREMHRVLKPGGRLFTTGPMPENKQLFYDVIREATGHPIPLMPGSSRYKSQIFPAMQATFARARLEIFENPLTFETVEPFMAYTRASLTEDRKLWAGFFQNKGDFEKVMEQIAKAAALRLERDGKLVMTKVVGGFIAEK